MCMKKKKRDSKASVQNRRQFKKHFAEVTVRREPPSSTVLTHTHTHTETTDFDSPHNKSTAGKTVVPRRTRSGC